MEKSKRYFVKLNKTNQMILNIYFSNYKIGKDKC